MKEKIYNIIKLLVIGISSTITMVISITAFILTQSNYRMISFIPEEFELILLGIIATISLFITAVLLLLLNENAHNFKAKP